MVEIRKQVPFRDVKSDTETGELIVSDQTLIPFDAADHLLVDVHVHGLQSGGQLPLGKTFSLSLITQTFRNYIFVIKKA